MHLPEVLQKLVKAQNHFDSAAYANCFTETAVVYDEGKTHKGKKEIESWIQNAQKQYSVSMKPLTYSDEKQTLHAEISGTFPGSPLTLTYHYAFSNGLIQSLRITG
jgi:hypothetical protein